MNDNGTVQTQQHVSATTAGFGGALDAGDEFGNAVASLGDLDADGVLDVAIGARRDDDGGTDQGAVWIVFLHADGTVKGQQKVSATAGAFAGDLDPGDRFGESIASVGDVDGDGLTDLAVGAEADDDGGTDQGPCGSSSEVTSTRATSSGRR